MALLNTQQKKALKRYVTDIPDFSTQTKLGEFLAMYFACHILAEKLIEYKKGKKGKQVRTDSIKSAVKTFGLQINGSIIDNIFFSDKKYTCRQLRNDYVHKFSEDAKNEIEARFNILKNDMKQWIDLFK